jgi:hypothetical protein
MNKISNTLKKAKYSTETRKIKTEIRTYLKVLLILGVGHDKAFLDRNLVAVAGTKKSTNNTVLIRMASLERIEDAEHHDRVDREVILVGI